MNNTKTTESLRSGAAAKPASREHWEHWLKQARSAIAQGQSRNDFIGNCHPDNRAIAYKAFSKANSEKLSRLCGELFSEVRRHL